MSATATPPISVVMSTFNSGPYLAPAIESILGQTWRDFEFIIVDDGSTDGTRERVAAYATRDPRICALPNEGNRGVPYTKGRLHTLARAPWIAQMDHDDVSRPERLARLLAAARAAPQAVFISSLRDILEPDGRIQPGPRGVCFERDLLAWFNMFYNRIGPDAALMYRASALREMLTLYSDEFDAGARRQIEGVKAVAAQPVVRRIPVPGPISFGRGLEITLTCDDGAFEGTGAFLLGAVMQHFFARYVSVNSFTETVLRTLERNEVARWPAQLGKRQTL